MDAKEQIEYCEGWLSNQRKALAAAIIHCKEIVDAIEKTEREIASLKVLEGRK